MFTVSDELDYVKVERGYYCVDLNPLVKQFSRVPCKELEINGNVYTLYTKTAFAEFEDGKVEKGLAYLLLRCKSNYTFASEICFTRITDVSELCDTLERARDCENFLHYFKGTFCINIPGITLRTRNDDDYETKTHLGSKRGISYGNTFVADDAVFIYGDELLDGWSDVDAEHVFSGSEWIIPENAVSVYENDSKKELPEGVDKVVIEEFDSNCELRQLAKALPFEKADYLNHYTYRPEENDRLRTVLLPTD